MFHDTYDLISCFEGSLTSLFKNYFN